jgi:DNA-binding transcriptional ArsR family regulator
MERDVYAGKPQVMKQVNDALIREALLARGEASNSDLVKDTGLSQTTVMQVLARMLREGIIEAGRKRASSGGRRAASWVLRPEAWTSLAIAIETESLSWALHDALGATLDSGRRSLGTEPGTELRPGTEPLQAALELASELEIRTRGPAMARRALAVGVPGAVKEGRILTGDFIEAWADLDLPALFKDKTGLPVVVENDLNAIALGYANSGEGGGARAESLIYIHFNGGACVGSGIVLGGRVFRGAACFAGELGFLPMGGGRILDDVMEEAARDEDFVAAIVATLRTVNCVINPALAALGGRGTLFALRAQIAQAFEAAVESELRPSLVFVEDSGPYYLSGLAHLAAEQIFPPFKLVDRRQQY